MAGFMPAIHAFSDVQAEVVDGRDKPGHDGRIRPVEYR
jgi:hypothetical protein